MPWPRFRWRTRQDSAPAQWRRAAGRIRPSRSQRLSRRRKPPEGALFAPAYPGCLPACPRYSTPGLRSCSRLPPPGPARLSPCGSAGLDVLVALDRLRGHALPVDLDIGLVGVELRRCCRSAVVTRFNAHLRPVRQDDPSDGVPGPTHPIEAGRPLRLIDCEVELLVTEFDRAIDRRALQLGFHGVAVLGAQVQFAISCAAAHPDSTLRPSHTYAAARSPSTATAMAVLSSSVRPA